MIETLTRRSALRLFAAAPIALAAGPALAGESARLERLIHDARSLPTISQRMEMVSRGLLGVRYQAHTLIGSRRRPEVLVVRDDAFDCVTFCEVVLAAAIARDGPAFEQALRQIRYEQGLVRFDQRNHYFSEWGRRLIEKRIGQALALDNADTIAKTVRWGALGQRRITMTGVPRDTLLANQSRLRSGDILGFVSRRPQLDVFHAGLVTIGKPEGPAMLRHASRSRGRIVDDPLGEFLTANRVSHVTVIRPVEPAVTTV